MAPNKFLAKIGSGWRKPDGLTVVPPERIEHFLQGLPVDALWGVGPVTASRLREHGIEKLIDVRTRPRADLEAVVGSLAEWLIELAYWGGLTQAEIAEEIDTPLGTVKSWMRRGLLRMRGTLEDLVE